MANRRFFIVKQMAEKAVNDMSTINGQWPLKGQVLEGVELES